MDKVLINNDLRRIVLEMLPRTCVLLLRLVSKEFYYLITQKSNHFWARYYFNTLPIEKNPLQKHRDAFAAFLSKKMVYVKVPSLVCYGVPLGKESEVFYDLIKRHSQYQSWVEEAKSHIFGIDESVPQAYVDTFCQDTANPNLSIFDINTKPWAIAGYYVHCKESRITLQEHNFVNAYCATQCLKILQWDLKCENRECYESVDLCLVYDDTINYRRLFESVLSDRKKRAQERLKRGMRHQQNMFQKEQEKHQRTMELFQRKLQLCTETQFSLKGVGEK